MSDNQVIPDAAVEAAFSRIADNLDDTETESWRELLRLALEAAAPHMLADGFARAYAVGFHAATDGRNYDAIGSNPYRSQA